MTKRRALGKGLSAIIPEADTLTRNDTVFFQCPIEEIQPNPYQPRLEFREEDLAELVNSVKEKGVITPLLVSKSEDGYRLIAGERRWRAAQRAGMERIPVVVRETTPMESLELALIENIHRKDLNPIEEALAYSRWLEDSQTTQEILAKKLGKDRSTITNMLRLLGLPKTIQKDLIEERLTMGHARVLAGLKSPYEQKTIPDQMDILGQYRFRWGQGHYTSLIGEMRFYNETSVWDRTNIFSLGVAPEFTLSPRVRMPVRLKYSIGNIDNGSKLSGIEIGLGLYFAF